jgi:hypothetical protein
MADDSEMEVVTMEACGEMQLEIRVHEIRVLISSSVGAVGSCVREVVRLCVG